MKQSRIVLLCAGVAACAAVLGGCAGQSARVDTGAAGPVVTSTENYKQQRFNESFRGLAVEGGEMVVDRAAAREVEPEGFAAAMARGESLMGENDFKGALGAYRSAVLADEGSAEAFVGIGWALLGEKKDDLALAAFASAVRLAPEDAAVRFRYAEAINAIGDLDGWASELARVVELDPAFGAAHARLAVARFYQGDRESARRHVGLADEFGGDVPAVLRERLKD